MKNADLKLCTIADKPCSKQVFNLSELKVASWFHQLSMKIPPCTRTLVSTASLSSTILVVLPPSLLSRLSTRKARLHSANGTQKRLKYPMAKARTLIAHLQVVAYSAAISADVSTGASRLCLRRLSTMLLMFIKPPKNTLMKCKTLLRPLPVSLDHQVSS